MLQLASTAVFTVMIGLYADASRDSASQLFRLLANPVFELVSSKGQLRFAWLVVSLLAVNLWLASAKWYDDFRSLEGLFAYVALPRGQDAHPPGASSARRDGPPAPRTRPTIVGHFV